MNNRKSLLRLLLLVSFCLATVTLHAQVINKTFKNETLKTVLKEVEQQTGLSVIYKTDEVNENKRITATFKNASLDEVLNKVLDKDLTYKLQNKMIVILKRRRNLMTAVQRRTSKEPSWMIRANRSLGPAW